MLWYYHAFLAFTRHKLPQAFLPKIEARQDLLNFPLKAAMLQPRHWGFSLVDLAPFPAIVSGMRLRKSFLLNLHRACLWPGLTLLVLSAIFSCVAAPSEGSQEGGVLAASVLNVSGQVRATTDGKTWRPLKRGDTLTAGMLIQTAKKTASVELRLGDVASQSPKVNLAENSVLGIKNLKTKGTGTATTNIIELDLRTGQLEGLLPGSAPGLDFEIEFPTGVVGARSAASQAGSTVYALNSSGALAVASGRVVVAMANGTEPQVVAANQQFDPATGRVTPLPKTMAEKLLQESQE